MPTHVVVVSSKDVSLRQDEPVHGLHSEWDLDEINISMITPDAIDQILALNPDVVILDTQEPSNELLPGLRKPLGKVPILSLSLDGNPEDLTRTLLMGITDYLGLRRDDNDDHAEIETDDADESSDDAGIPVNCDDLQTQLRELNEEFRRDAEEILSPSLPSNEEISPSPFN